MDHRCPARHGFPRLPEREEKTARLSVHNEQGKQPPRLVPYRGANSLWRARLQRVRVTAACACFQSRSLPSSDKRLVRQGTPK